MNHVVRAAACVALSATLVGACKESASHIYGARRYVPSRDCVESTTAVDVVQGQESTEACAAVCLVSPPSEDGGRETYVSRECPPLPPGFDTSGQVPGCDRALAAYARNDTCIDGGTSTNPADAGTGG